MTDVEIYLPTVTANTSTEGGLEVVKTVFDPEGNSVTIENGKFTPLLVGDYTVTYSCVDSWGNTASESYVIKINFNGPNGKSITITVVMFASMLIILVVAVLMAGKMQNRKPAYAIMSAPKNDDAVVDELDDVDDVFYPPTAAINTTRSGEPVVITEPDIAAESEIIPENDTDNIPAVSQVQSDGEIIAEEESTVESNIPDGENNNVSVMFNTENKTVQELYEELPDNQRTYYDIIRARAESKNKVKTSQAKDGYTVFYGRDKIVKLRIRKNTVEAIFFVTDNAFKKLPGTSGIKIKETPTVIKITNDEHLKLALEAVDYRYDTVIAERKAKQQKHK